MTIEFPVSVIIPAHNAGQTVERAIASAFAAGADEVVVINDKSRDNTDSVIDLLTEVYPPDKYKPIHARFNLGVCHARNTAIEQARWDFILPLDADDQLLPNGIELLFDTPASVTYGNYIDGATGHIIDAPPPQRLAQKNLTGATYLFSRNAWRKVGGYHPDFQLGCEDWALMCALVNDGFSIARVEQPIYVYSPGGKRAARCAKYADTIRQLLAEHYPAVFNAQPSR